MRLVDTWKKSISGKEIPDESKCKIPEAGRRTSNEIRVANRGTTPEWKLWAKSQSVLEGGKEFGF